MTSLAEKVQQELIQAIENDELVLPTLPEVALKVREANDKRDRDERDGAEVDA